MKDLVIKAIKDFSLFDNVNHISVALSGGADSVALLHILNTLKSEYGYTLSALHFNHLIRGEESDSDAKFAENFCNELNIPIAVGSGNVPQYATENGIGIELAAREMRYAFFESNRKNGVVATAHTASDNLETVLFNLTRGTALQGLCGIPAKRDFYIRPLIYCARQDVENYCKENNLRFVTDSTNLSNDYSRNKIRHLVVPVLREINPGVEKSAINTCASVREALHDITDNANEYIKKFANGTDLDLCEFSKLSETVKKQVIYLFLADCNKIKNIQNCHINAVSDIVKNAGYCDIPGEYTVYSDRVNLSLLSTEKLKCDVSPYQVKIEKQKNVNNLFSINCIDCDKISGCIKVRTRLPGDKIRLYNKQHTKTLKQLFNEYKVPEYLRKHIPVIADDLGVVWVYPFGVAKRCQTDSSTANTAVVTVTKLKES